MKRALSTAGLEPPRFIDKGVSFTALVSRPALPSAEGARSVAMAQQFPQLHIAIRPPGARRPAQPERGGADDGPFPAEGGARAVPPPADGVPGTEVTTHAPPLWRALESGPLSVAALVTATGLTRHQVRYAIDKLVEAGWVTVDGGWGVRGTTYRRRRA